MNNELDKGLRLLKQAERCECCGEGKDPANPNGLDWETLCAEPVCKSLTRKEDAARERL